MENVILVNEHDVAIGTMEKLEAHEKGLLHRAFSIFVFNSKNELLLQRRALTKYHSAGLWTNTCCSHPRPEEETIDAAHRRLKEEMGFDTELNFKTKFIYKTPFENGLTEHELDYVFVGYYNLQPNINTNEVESFRWTALQDLKQEIKSTPQNFTSWFKIAINSFDF